MQRDCDDIPGSMLTVFTTTESQVKLCLNAALEHCVNKHQINNPCCEVAIHLYPHCKVL